MCRQVFGASFSYTLQILDDHNCSVYLLCLWRCYPDAVSALFDSYGYHVYSWTFNDILFISKASFNKWRHDKTYYFYYVLCSSFWLFSRGLGFFKLANLFQCSRVKGQWTSVCSWKSWIFLILHVTDSWNSLFYLLFHFHCYRFNPWILIKWVG